VLGDERHDGVGDLMRALGRQIGPPYGAVLLQDRELCTGDLPGAGPNWFGERSLIVTDDHEARTQLTDHRGVNGGRRDERER
jgi:hypothetical protein